MDKVTEREKRVVFTLSLSTDGEDNHISASFRRAEGNLNTLAVMLVGIATYALDNNDYLAKVVDLLKI